MASNLSGPGLAIYSEGDAERGLGHLNRCLAYAEAVHDGGGRVRWIVDGDASAMRTLKGWAVEPRRWQADPATGVAPDEIAVVDSYEATDAVLAALSANARRAVFLDDLRRADYPPGLVVHATPGGIEPRPGGAHWLIGPVWQPLRAPFRDLALRSAVSPEVGRVLVAFGATDVRGLAGPAARIVRRVFPGAEIDVILGQGVDARSTGEFAGVTVNRRLSPPEVASLDARADLAVGAAGQTLYEWARAGLPAVIVGVADNQGPHLERWPATGAFVSAGWWDAPHLADRIEAGLRALASTRARLAAARAGQSAVDGRGVERLFKWLRTDLASG